MQQEIAEGPKCFVRQCINRKVACFQFRGMAFVAADIKKNLPAGNNIRIILERAKVPLGPFVIGFVLAPLAEAKLRSGLMMSGGSFLPIVTRPLALAFLVASVLMLLWPFYGEWRRRRRAEGAPG